MSQHSIMISADAYAAARRRAAFVERADRGCLLVSGADRRAFLQGLLTNDVAALAAGQGCYAAYLTPQGRMITDLFVHELGDGVLLDVPLHVKDDLLSKLDQLVFTEDVQLRDATAAYTGIAVVGPDAPRVVAATLEGTGQDALAAMPEHANLRAAFREQPALVVRSRDAGEPGFIVYLDVSAAGPLRAALEQVGGVVLDAATADALRIEAGIPRFGRDMDEETIPLEAGIESRAISFTKGCYVGQEVVVRVLHRGHGRVARRLVGLTIEGDAPPPAGAVLHAGDREVGRITSSTMSPALHRPIALAYLQRDFVDPGARLVVGGTTATVVDLPFVTPGA